MKRILLFLCLATSLLACSDSLTGPDTTLPETSFDPMGGVRAPLPLLPSPIGITSEDTLYVVSEDTLYARSRLGRN